MKKQGFVRSVKITVQTLTLSALSMAVLNAGAATELTVYTGLEANDLKKYAERFNEDYPDIKLNWVRDSTGVITAKLLAEKENPRADVVWGLAGTSLLLLDKEGMLEPYAPVGVEKLSKGFRDVNNPPTWTGMNAWVASICFNTYEAEKYNLPKPTSWKDLHNPIYQGHLVMPNPGSSGTGYLDVSSWLQMFGTEGAGPIWMACTRISAAIPTPVPNPASSLPQVRFRSASPMPIVPPS